MKKTISIRAMLISLFVAAVLGSIVLAGTGWMTNQRLINVQHFVADEVLLLGSKPAQEDSEPKTPRSKTSKTSAKKDA